VSQTGDDSIFAHGGFNFAAEAITFVRFWDEEEEEEEEDEAFGRV